MCRDWSLREYSAHEYSANLKIWINLGDTISVSHFRYSKSEVILNSSIHLSRIDCTCIIMHRAFEMPDAEADPIKFFDPAASKKVHVHYVSYCTYII